MILTKPIEHENIKKNPYLLINLIFSFFPISFIIGSFAVNLNLLIFCCWGLFYLRSKILKIKYEYTIKIIFLFFLVVFFSTSLSVIKALYFKEYTEIDLDRFIKSIVFFRYFLFLLTIYLLNKFNILNFKYFFLVSSLSALILSLDLIYQYVFGFDLIGLQGYEYRNSGFFGDEFIAGTYLQRFGIFTLLFIILVLKNKNHSKFFLCVLVICLLGVGILVSGNKMPLFLFIFGLLIAYISKLKIKKILSAGLIALLLILQLIISSNEQMKNLYGAFFHHAKNTIVMTTKVKTIPNVKVLEKEEQMKQLVSSDHIPWESFQKRIFLTAIDTWKFNRVFGNGIKSFREVCHKLREMPNFNLEEDLYPGKKNRLCSNHPHNYYFEILSETGVVGLIVIFILGLIFVNFIFKNHKLLKENNVENFILASAIISLILETFPLRTSGSLFTTNNSTYIILIVGIILSYKNLLKTKI